jgi:enoyl-CoA hydratase
MHLMTHTCFDVSIENNIAHLVMIRPEKRNAMNEAFWRELPEIVRKIDADASARVIVISSTGPHFTAGIDLAMLATALVDDGSADHRMQRPQKFLDLVKQLQDTFTALEQCRIPVLAAVQGGCIGGGVDLTTACDLRYATKDAYFTIQEINIGMTADVGTFPRIVKLMPEGVVRELAYTGRKLTASEAHQFGLVNQVFEDQAEMLQGVMKIAAEIAAKSPNAIIGSKRIITYARDHSTADTLDYIGVWNMSMLMPEEIMEAVGAGPQKRAARFVDMAGKKG